MPVKLEIWRQPELSSKDVIVFSDNGGGINISSTGGVLLENLNVYGNQSSGGGGGIFIGADIVPG